MTILRNEALTSELPVNPPSSADMTALPYLCKIHTRVLHEALKPFNNY